MKKQIVYRIGQSDAIWEYIEILGDRYMRSTCDEFAKTNVIPLIETPSVNDHSIVLIESLEGEGFYIFWATDPEGLEENFKDEIRDLPPSMKLEYLRGLCSKMAERLELPSDISLAHAKEVALSCWEELSYFSTQVEDEGLF